LHSDNRKIEVTREDLHQGMIIIMVEDEDHENDGDLAMAAEKVAPETIHFMANEGRGLICLTLIDGCVD